MLIETDAPLSASTGLCRVAAMSTNAALALVERGVNVRELRGEFSHTPLCVCSFDCYCEVPMP
jgi:hypothetical protein